MTHGYDAQQRSCNCIVTSSVCNIQHKIQIIAMPKKINIQIFQKVIIYIVRIKSYLYLTHKYLIK